MQIINREDTRVYGADEKIIKDIERRGGSRHENDLTCVRLKRE